MHTSIFLMSRECVFKIKGMLNSPVVQVLVWLFSPYCSTVLYNLLQHQRPLLLSCLFLSISGLAFLLLVLSLFWCHSKLLTHNKILQHLDFCQASLLIKAAKLISPLTQIQEPTTLAMLFLFVQLGSSEEFQNQCNHAWLMSKTQQGSGRSKPPETCG